MTELEWPEVTLCLIIYVHVVCVWWGGGGEGVQGVQGSQVYDFFMYINPPTPNNIMFFVKQFNLVF